MKVRKAARRDVVFSNGLEKALSQFTLVLALVTCT